MFNKQTIISLLFFNTPQALGNVLSLGRGALTLEPEPKAQPPSSFFQISHADKKADSKKADLKMSRYMKAITEDKDVQKAEAEWQASKKHTDEMLAKVHDQMAKLNKDLELTEQQEKQDLANLQANREKEDKQLEETEKKLEKMAKDTLKMSEQKPKSLASFLEESEHDPQFESIFAPLKNAAASAKKFAEEMKQRAEQFEKMKTMSPSSMLEEVKKMDKKYLPEPISPESFIQSEAKNSKDSSDLDVPEFTPDFSGSTEKRDHSLSLAQKALSKLNQDLAIQRKHLEEEENRLHEEEQKDAHSSSDAASFLQTGMFDLTKLPGFGGPKDPLSPESLQAWSQKFEAKLREARDIARQGLPEDMKTTSSSSFLETSDLGQWPPASYVEAQENIRRGQKDIERMDEQFKEGMAKLKQENAQMMAEAKRDLEKNREIQEELEARKMKSNSGMSLLQETGDETPIFDAKKEEDHIRDLERGWKRQAADIASSGSLKLAKLDQEQHSLMEQIKEKEDAENSKMDSIQQKLNQDLEKLHKDVLSAQEKAHADSAAISCLQV